AVLQRGGVDRLVAGVAAGRGGRAGLDAARRPRRAVLGVEGRPGAARAARRPAPAVRRRRPGALPGAGLPLCAERPAPADREGLRERPAPLTDRLTAWRAGCWGRARPGRWRR